MLTDGIQSTVVTNISSAGKPSSLRPGQILQGVVRGEPGNLTIHVAGSRIPVESSAQLEAGQNVRVETTATENGLQLRITPQSTSQQSSGVPEQLTTALSYIIKSLPALQALDNPEQMLPANLPTTEAAIRNLLSLFATRQSTAQDLQLLVSLLNKAAESGVVSREYAMDFAAIAARFVSSEGGELSNILHQLADNSGANLEAQIATAIASGNIEKLLDKLKSSLRWQVSRLRGNEALMKYMQGSGQLRAFQNAVESIIERLTGGQLQDLRSLEQSYVFIEVPFSMDDGIYRAQIHFFGDGRGKGKRFDAKNSTVMIDLSTTQLGDLWISLQLVKGHCTCSLRAASPEVVGIIRSSSDDLKEGLAKAGYSNARVQVSQWNGNRLQEVANMMRRFSGFNATI